MYYGVNGRDKLNVPRRVVLWSENDTGGEGGGYNDLHAAIFCTAVWRTRDRNTYTVTGQK